MALSRRGARLPANIWPGFVDAMTALLLVLMFVLSIFMIVQFILRETINTQDTELNQLSAQVASLAEALGLEQQKVFGLEEEVDRLGGELQTATSREEVQAALIATLTAQAENQQTRIADFEAQVASLLAEQNRLVTLNADLAGQLETATADNAALVTRISEAEAENLRIASEQEALQLALARAREEIDEGAEQARLAAARREALEALIAELRTEAATRETSLAEALAALQAGETSTVELQAELDALRAALSDEERARLAEAAAAEALRKRLADTENALTDEERDKLAEAAAAEALRNKLQNAEAELTAMTLALEEQRKKAEETLTLLAAADAAKADIDNLLAATLLARDTLQADLEAALGRETELTDEKKQVDALLAAALAAQETLAAKLALAETDSETARDAVAALEKKLEEALADLQSRDATIATRNLDIDDLKKELAAALAAQLASEQDRTALNDRLAAVVAALEEAQTRAEVLEGQGATADELQKQLAAALAAKLKAEREGEEALSAKEQREILLARANTELGEQKARTADAERRLALLNQQTAALQSQLRRLQGLLDAANARDAEARIQIESLGSNLNAALAQIAEEQRKLAEESRKLAEEERRRAEAEAARAKLLEEQARTLEKFRSDFFGRLREVFADREGVRIEGDRFVFSSEVLFPPGGTELAPAGEDQIIHIAEIIREVASEIPPEIDWVLRVDGHTDNVPLSGTGKFADNWELSQARALAVVKFMIEELRIPPNRLAATGFGEFRPLDDRNTPAARAKNRRIELKFTER